MSGLRGRSTGLDPVMEEGVNERLRVRNSDERRHWPWSALADENDIVVPEPSRYMDPLTLRDALDEMDVLNHRFLYFVDAADYRLVEPR